MPSYCKNAQVLKAAVPGDINPATVIHLISQDNKLKMVAREMPPFDRLALFSGRVWRGRVFFLNTKQSIKLK